MLLIQIGNQLATVAAVSVDANNKIMIRSNKAGENTKVQFNVTDWMRRI